MTGTQQAVGAPISDEETARLWAVVDGHAQVDGQCRICGTPRRCWERSYAVERLIMSDRYHLPRTTDLAAQGSQSREENTTMKWTRPMRCDNSSPSCVEVAADDAGNRHVRDSKDPSSPVLTFTPAEWDAFEESIRNGQRF